jgi:hypothetical protein
LWLSLCPIAPPGVPESKAGVLARPCFSCHHSPTYPESKGILKALAGHHMGGRNAWPMAFMQLQDVLTALDMCVRLIGSSTSTVQTSALLQVCVCRGVLLCGSNALLDLTACLILMSALLDLTACLSALLAESNHRVALVGCEL